MKAILLLIMLHASLFAFPAKVVKISDGDTITVLSGKEQTKVRLYGIDAPEKKARLRTKIKTIFSQPDRRASGRSRAKRQR